MSTPAANTRLKVGFYFSPRDWHYPGYPQAMVYRDDYPIPPAEENFENFKAFYAYTLGQIGELPDPLRQDRPALVRRHGLEEYRGYARRADARLGPIVAAGPSSSIRVGAGPATSPPPNARRASPSTGNRANGGEACDIWPRGHWGYVPSEDFKPLSWGVHAPGQLPGVGRQLPVQCRAATGRRMPEVFYDRCKELNEWMAHSGASVIGAGPAPEEARSNVPITTGEKVWYLHALPDHEGPVLLRTESEPKAIKLLRTGATLVCQRQGDELEHRTPGGDANRDGRRCRRLLGIIQSQRQREKISGVFVSAGHYIRENQRVQTASPRLIGTSSFPGSDRAACLDWSPQIGYPDGNNRTGGLIRRLGGAQRLAAMH